MNPMSKRLLRKNETLYNWFTRSLAKHGLTPTSRNLSPDDYRILRNYYEKYNRKCVQAGIIPGWSGYVK